jgi:hypothetical protein
MDPMNVLCSDKINYIFIGHMCWLFCFCKHKNFLITVSLQLSGSNMRVFLVV